MANKQLGVDFDNKTTLSNNDTFSIADSEAGNATKDVTLGNLTAPITLDQGNTRVGINNATPDKALTVQEAADNTGINVKNSAGNERLNISTNASNGGYITLKNNSGTSNISIKGDGDTYFNGGEVGIGTNVPASKLTLNYRNFAGDSNSAVTFDGETTDNTKSVLNLRDYGGTSILYARNDGNVGIGTTSPGYNLDVLAGVDDHAVKIFNDGNGFNRKGLLLQGGQDSGGVFTAITIKDGNAANSVDIGFKNGNIGIGTTSPEGILHVEDTTDATLIVNSTSNGTNTRLKLLEQAQSLNDYGFMMEYDSSNTIFSSLANGVESEMMIFEHSSGYVGINTSNPAAQLDVISTSASDNTILARGKYGLQIQQDITGGYAFRARQLTGMTANYTAEIAQENAATSNSALQITNEGTGAGLFIDQNGNGVALNIDSEATTRNGVTITHEGTSARAMLVQGNGVRSANFPICDITDTGVQTANSIGLQVYSNQADTNGRLVSFRQDNASSVKDVLQIQNDGTGLSIDCVGQVRLAGLPTSSAGLSAGDLWNNSGVINIV